MGSVEWMFLFLYGGNFVFDCCLYLSFRGPDPRGPGQRDASICVSMCGEVSVSISVCVCEAERLMVGSTLFFPTAAAQRINRHPQGNITQVAFEQKSWILLMIW